MKVKSRAFRAAFSEPEDLAEIFKMRPVQPVLAESLRQQLMDATSEVERLQDERDLQLKDIENLTKERDKLYKTNRILVDIVRDDGKQIRELKGKRPCARGFQLWLADEQGRHNLMQDYVAQRAEPRLGVMPWL